MKLWKTREHILRKTKKTANKKTLENYEITKTRMKTTNNNNLPTFRLYSQVKK